MTDEWDDLRKRAIRVRIQRILSQNGTPEDIRLVFSDLRFGKGCPPEVQDLAHFAAHRPENRTCGFPASRLSDQGPFMLSPTGSCALSVPNGPARASRKDTRRDRLGCQLPVVGVWRTTTGASDIGNGHPLRGRLC